jgi:2-enoate reductase
MVEFHKTGAKLFVQLTAGFGRSFAVNSTMEKIENNKVLNFLAKPVLNVDRICASASPSPESLVATRSPRGH